MVRRTTEKGLGGWNWKRQKTREGGRRSSDRFCGSPAHGYGGSGAFQRCWLTQIRCLTHSLLSRQCPSTRLRSLTHFSCTFCSLLWWLLEEDSGCVRQIHDYKRKHSAAMEKRSDSHSRSRTQTHRHRDTERRAIGLWCVRVCMCVCASHDQRGQSEVGHSPTAAHSRRP